MYFDVFVNGSIITLILVYLITRRMDLKRLKGMLSDPRTARVIIVSLWVILIGAATASCLLYPELERSHDIDDAVEAASRHFIHGGNPYEDEVVPRFSERYHGEGTGITNSTYNYMPLSLFTYSLFYIILSPLGSFWFPFTNLILGALSIWMTSLTFPDLRKRYSIPLIGTVSLFFMFDNIMLTLFFLTCAFYFIVRSRTRYRYYFALLFLFLSFFIKLIGLIPLAVFGLYLLQRYRLRSRNVNIQIGGFILTALLIAAPSILLFGIMNVADSTVFFFSDVETRTESSGFGGTLLTLIIGHSSYFSLFTNAFLVLLIGSSLFIKDIYSRLFLPASLLPFLTIKASQALLMIPFYSLLVLLLLDLFPEWELSGERKKKNGPDIPHR